MRPCRSLYLRAFFYVFLWLIRQKRYIELVTFHVRNMCRGSKGLCKVTKSGLVKRLGVLDILLQILNLSSLMFLSCLTDFCDGGNLVSAESSRIWVLAKRSMLWTNNNISQPRTTREFNVPGLRHHRHIWKYRDDIPVPVISFIADFYQDPPQWCL